MAHDVFISHSSKDRTIANAVCAALEAEKIRCWVAPRDIRPGYTWAEGITDAIEKSKIMVLIFSKNSNASKDVFKELTLAVNSGVIVIPLRTELIEPKGAMKYYLSDVHWLDAINPLTERQIRDLLKVIESVIGKDKASEEEEVLDKKKIKREIETIEPDVRGSLKEKTVSHDQLEVSDKTKPKHPIKKKISKKNLVLILSSVALIAIIGITLTLLRDKILGGEEELISSPSSKTQESLPEQTQESTITETAMAEEETLEDYGFDLDMEVDIPDPVLMDCIVTTLEYMGVPPKDGGLTVKDMLKLKKLVLTTSHTEEVGALVIIDEHESIQEYKYINDTPLESLEGLEYAKNLDCLVISEQNIDDIKALSGLSNLHILFLASNNISDLSPLVELRNLNLLILAGNPFEDVSLIENLSDLGVLGLNECEFIRDFSPIAKLAKLEFLDVNNTSFEDLLILQEMSNLRDLHLAGLRISDYSILGQLPFKENIESLVLDGNNIRDISFLSSLNTNLHGLSLNDNQIEDISVLNGLSDLTHLSIIRNNISDLSPLADLVNLQELLIDENTYNKNPGTINKLIENGCRVNPD